jgi:dTDP-4-dehydrorhamnose reductase
MVVLVTGAKGQLGQSLYQVSGLYPEIHFIWLDSIQLNISDFQQVQNVFDQYQPDFCINAAAFTAVDLAESTSEKAFLINEMGVQNIASACLKHQTVMLHVSTDFVFDGNKKAPYLENDSCNPLNVYGKSKWAGEQVLREILPFHYIIRTSWVFSTYGSNFLKTMLRLGSQKDVISVVDDQFGRPTSAVELAKVLVQMMVQTHYIKVENAFGIYHFANEGSCSWFDFASEIMKRFQLPCQVNPIHTSQYPTPAQRPKFSVLSTEKLTNTFPIQIKNWKQILEELT